MSFLRGKIIQPDAAAPVAYIQFNRLTGIGPTGIIFKGSCGGFGLFDYFRKPTYRWTFGDPDSMFTRLAANMPWGQNANVVYGPDMAHFFHPPASAFAGASSKDFTITLDILWNGAVQATAQQIVTLQNPDIYYAGANTLLVDSTGDYTLGQSLYTGAVGYTTLDAALSAITNNQRILIRGGQTHTATVELNGLNTYIGSFRDTGEAYPIISGTGLVIGTGASGATAIVDLELDGGYDPTIPSAWPDHDGIWIRGASTQGKFATLGNLKITGYEIGVSIDGKRLHNVIANCDFPAWANFGVFQGNSGWIGIVGCTIMQPTATVNGPGRKSDGAPGNEPDHGPVRLSRCILGAPIIINNCDMASRNNHSATEANQSVQPCLRVNNGGDPDLPRITQTQLRLFGAQLSLPATNGYSASWPVLAKTDMIYHVRWGQGGRHVGSSFGGSDFTNIISVEPANDWAKGGVFNCGPGGYADVGSFKDDYPLFLGYPDGDGVIQYRQGFRGITIIKLATQADIDIASNPIALTDFDSNSLYPAEPRSRNPDSVTTAGVVIHAPAWGLTEDVETGDAITGYPLPDGARWQTTIPDTSYAVPASVMASYTPTQHIPCDPGEIADMPPTDFFGNLRDPLDPTKGAIEFAA